MDTTIASLMSKIVGLTKAIEDINDCLLHLNSCQENATDKQKRGATIAISFMVQHREDTSKLLDAALELLVPDE